jgi:hypothetical protein
MFNFIRKASLNVQEIPLFWGPFVITLKLLFVDYYKTEDAKQRWYFLINMGQDFGNFEFSTILTLR